MEALQRLHNRGSISTGYDIENSLKFETANNEWLIRNSPTAGNRKTHTFSFWVKRTALGTINASGSQGIIGQGQHGRMFFGSDYFQYRFDDGHDVRDITTLFRDTAAWYHIVVAVDTNQSTSSNRVKIYYNGVQTTTIDHDGGSYPDIQDSASGWFNTNNITIGTLPFGASYTAGDGDYDMSGYLADFAAVDGTQYAPTDFGEFDEDTGIWKPKDLSDITWGSEGYYLKFDDSSNLGADSSGNGNNFTLNNIAAADQATDTPTNNFAIQNAIWGTDRMPLMSEGATEIGNNVNAYRYSTATIGITSGKWYWEIKPTVNGNTLVSGAGIASNQTTLAFYQTTGNFVYHYDGDRYVNGSAVSSYGAAWSTNDIIGFAYDADNWTLTCYVNNSSQGNLLAGQTDLSGELFIPYVYSFGTHTYQTNFGGYTTMSNTHTNTDENGYGSFVYAPPSGYYALCTKNLEEFG